MTVAKSKGREHDAKTKLWPRRLLRLRMSLGFSGPEPLAEKLGVKLDTFQRWVMGESKPRGPVAKLIEALEAEAEDVSRHDRRTLSRGDAERCSRTHTCSWASY